MGRSARSVCVAVSSQEDNRRIILAKVVFLERRKPCTVEEAMAWAKYDDVDVVPGQASAK